ncbi:hypothetical protein FRC09_010255 [Ceratobasidium sp. 395]|nr:hypothetical protein FRC09_010255 [Ceratobasidium sp. 395]
MFFAYIVFPDRVGRVVLDGVVDPLNWANKPPHEKWAVNVESTDEALTGFASACAMAGSEGCAFANIGSTTESLLQDIRGLIDESSLLEDLTFDTRQLTYEYKKKYGPDADMSSADLREYIYQAMYGPNRWPALATKLQAIRASLKQVMSGSSRRSFELPPWQEITKRQANASNPDESDLPSSTYAIHAITCTDAVDPGDTTTRMVFDEIVRVTREVSPMFGPIWNIAGFVCHKWPVRAVERYTGPWNKKLSNPILVIGNEADPVTPYINAKHVTDALGESAVLIEQDDYGHVSLAMKSTCTTAALNNYFLNNQLPSADQFCGTNQMLFPGPGITKSTLAALSGSSSMGSSNPSDLETELSKARERVNQLFVAVVALGRKKKEAQWTQWTHVTHNTFESKGHEDQGHIYTTPYDPVKVTKKDGYAPVQT